jgi:hypothetical protein
MDWIGRIVPGPEFVISPVARVAGDITCRKQKALGNQGTSLAAAQLWILQMSQFPSEEVALVAPTRIATLGKKEQSMWSSKESNGGSTHERQVRHRRALTPSWQVIAIRAYHIWESRGCPDGTDVRDWLQAENELQAASTFRSGQREERQLREWIESDALIDEASEESFPASDPPASTHCTST